MHFSDVYSSRRLPKKVCVGVAGWAPGAKESGGEGWGRSSRLCVCRGEGGRGL